MGKITVRDFEFSLFCQAQFKL